MWERELFYFDFFLLLPGGALPFFFFLQPAVEPPHYKDLGTRPALNICNPYYKSAQII
jgi:hypothetical protein